MKRVSMDNPVLRFCGWVGDLFLLDVLWVVTSLPLLTIGASSTAAYYVILKKLRGEEVPVFRGYFHSFAQNFKQATLLWVIYAALAADAVILVYQFCGGTFSFAAITSNLWLTFGVVCFAVVWVFSFLYAFPMLSLLDMTLGQCVKNALMLSMKHFFNTLVIVITAVALILLLNMVYYLVVIVLGVIFYVQAALVYQTMLPYLPKNAPETESASDAGDAPSQEE